MQAKTHTSAEAVAGKAHIRTECGKVVPVERIVYIGRETCAQCQVINFNDTAGVRRRRR